MASVLLDTHALLWWVHQPSSLSRVARQMIADGADQVFVSAVSAMEIATKDRAGKLEFRSALATSFRHETAIEGFRELPISVAHAQLAGSYRIDHKDPWDRLLAAQ